MWPAAIEPEPAESRQTQRVPVAQSARGASMQTRRNFLAIGAVGIFAVSLGLQALAQDVTPKDFVAGIYHNYEGKGAKGIPLNSPKLRRLLTPSLLKLIDDDGKRAARRHQPPELDGDAFVDAQEWEIKSFDIDVQDDGSDKASAKVSFKNFDQESTVTLALLKVNSAWRVDDISGSDGSLRKLLAK
jgi:hypothetical protein